MTDDAIPFRTSLSIATDDDDTAANESDTVPLRTKIIQVVKSAPDFTIRPARLSQELGLSVTDASAELCGLLKAVGEGSTFRFESMEGGIHTMVFSFPPDFEAKASAARRSEDWKQNLQLGLEIGLKVLKMLTAFGLILSTLIVSIAGMVAMVAAIVAVSRGGDSRTRNHLSRQLHNLFLMTRQLLWCYAMFGPVGEDQDPFFREAAYDTSLILSLCCGNPASMWFWFRARHLRQRRRRMARGWGRMMSSANDYGDATADLEGVRLIRRGSWGQEEIVPVHSGGSDEQRGLLSIAVEFLFGPSKPPGPTDADRWRMRSAVIVEKSLKPDGSSPISLKELTPFVDSPPSSLDDTDKVVSEALFVVAYFNGVPFSVESNSEVAAKGTLENMSEAKFVFPELLAESAVAVRYDDPQSVCTSSVDSKSRLRGLFFLEESSSPVARRNRSSRAETPSFLYEQCKVLTALSSRQFYHCFLVAILNLIGVIWFAQSLQLGGILEQTLAPRLVQALNWSLIPMLKFYAKLFFTIPFIRLLYILAWNEFCRKRNERRAELASQLKD